MLKTDGIIGYSTCTFSPEENEQTIEAFLSRYTDMELLPIEKPEGIQDGRPDWSINKNEELKKTARLWPHMLPGEGHFVAKMKKTGEAQPSSVTNADSNLGKSQLKDFRQFSSET